MSLRPTRFCVFVFLLIACTAPARTQVCQLTEDVDFAHEIGCRADFDRLASTPLDESVPGARSSKTIVDRAQSDALYFLNGNQYPRHHAFALDYLSGGSLPPVPDLARFNDTAYSSPTRRFLLGAVTYYEGPDRWTYELAPYDDASPEMIETAMKAIRRAAFFGDELSFHPTSRAQEELAQDLAGWVQVVTSDELFGGIAYQPLNLGEALGQLRFVGTSELETTFLGPRDVVVLDNVPNDISVVAGLITAERQTPLSHVNVLSQNRGTPNMSLRDAFDDAELRALEGRWVRLDVGAFDYTVEEVTRDDADAWWELHRPPPVHVPELDLEVSDLRDVADLGPDDIPAFGGKASNYGVMARLGPDVPHPAAFGIPVRYYRDFESDNGFDARIEAFQTDERFLDDPQFRRESLEALQADMLVAPVDPAFETLLMNKLATEFAGLRMRFRSSTNAEDLAGLSGAGLYSSASGEPGDPRRPVLDAIRYTWASLWNFRAYEERTYNGIPHDAVAMAILVHHSFPDEEANGVALTNNLFDETEPAFFVNVQLGEESVVQPDPGVEVDSFLYYYYHPSQPTTYLSSSSLVPPGSTVLSHSQLQALGRALDAIHEGFRDYYDVPGGFYAMDVEFKFDDLGMGGEPRLWIKQARPHLGWAGEM